MVVLAAPAEVELVVQRSRFLARLVVVHEAAEARRLLAEAKATYADASHVVHAFRLGPPGSETLGCSDDGEPPGTAGRPVLDVLRGAGGSDALLLVVRWFGGIKLGTGGLVKAYSEAAKAVVAQASWQRQRSWVEATVAVDWADHPRLRRQLAEVGAEGVTEAFGAGVEVRARIPAEAFADLVVWTRDLTRGRGLWVAEDGGSEGSAPRR